MLAVGGLAAQMRAGSQQEHEAAERSPTIRALMAGKLSATAYGTYLRQYQPVYAALEAAANTLATQSEFATLMDPRLNRSSSIAEDLADLGAEDAPLTDASIEYGERIRRLAAEWPPGYVAHHYTRYLGDLSGGQAIGAVLARSLGLTRERGLRFYDFPGIVGPRFKSDYREALDRLDWGEACRRQVVDETRFAFILNQRLLTELGELLL